MTNDEKLLYLIKYLLAEDSRYKNIQISSDKTDRFDLFRSLVNIRPPKPIDDNFLKVQDEFLQEEIAADSDIAGVLRDII
ncbi:MAG: hypothetical protein ACI4JF_10260 [Oscillospiraceae bacterium]